MNASKSETQFSFHFAISDQKLFHKATMIRTLKI